MDAHRSENLPAFEPDGLSRRVVLRAGAGGLAAAVMVQKIDAALAQDATPEADSGLPEGVSIASLSAVPIRDLPAEPFTIHVARVTLEPGAVIPNSSVSYPSMAYVEEGEGLMCPPAGEGRWVYDAEGKVIASGAGEFAFPLGTWCYTAPDTLDGVRNDGAEPVTVLVMDLVPTAE